MLQGGAIVNIGKVRKVCKRGCKPRPCRYLPVVIVGNSTASYGASDTFVLKALRNAVHMPDHSALNRHLFMHSRWSAFTAPPASTLHPDALRTTKLPCTTPRALYANPVGHDATKNVPATVPIGVPVLASHASRLFKHSSQEPIRCTRAVKTTSSSHSTGMERSTVATHRHNVLDGYREKHHSFASSVFQ